MRLFIKIGKSTIPAFLLLSFFTLAIHAQHVPIKRSHSINSHTTLNHGNSTAQSQHTTVNIVAVRVAFQPDTNRFTTGNGTFQSDNLSYLDTTTITIDPLPHDRSYFNAHLEFAKNYFEHVSNGQVSINYRLLPQIYQLEHKMAHYSPTGQSFTNEPLARLVRDVWQKVEAEGGFDSAGLNPQNTTFAIFHAGVGRDLQLTGTSLTITPQDLPSIFLGPEQLREHLGSFNQPGFPINDGSFHVNNSMILPRTLSRPGTTLGQDFVLQLSINGLLAASIGSYLGLPDLFNTETGNSGIGRFGLMDGASFFSYNGLFPPEPSAWEKTYLGWQDPAEIELNQNRHIELPAVSRHRAKSIGRYSISSDEYFLVENRHRDPEMDGATLTIQTPDGNTVQQHFSNRNEVFTFQQEGFDTLFTPGVVTDVDNFDFSLPGGLGTGPDGESDTEDDRLLNGGILIWHIDEAVIENNLSSQSVNANPDRRGVDLEEADGAQDIGSEIGGGIGSVGTRGGPFDFWWSGNDASVITQTDTLTLYENRFGPDTRPSNHSNTGAPGFFAFTDFSDNLPVARFKAVPSSPAHVKKINMPVDQLNGIFSSDPQQKYFEAYPWDMSIYSVQNDTFLIVPSRNHVNAVRLGGSTPAAVTRFDLQNPQQPYLGSRLVLAEAPAITTLDANGASRLQADTTDPAINGWSWQGNQWQQDWSANISDHLGFVSSRGSDTLQTDLGPTLINIVNGETESRSDPYFQESERRGAVYARAFSDRVNAYTSSEQVNINVSSGNNRWAPYTGLFPLSRNRPGFYVFQQNRFSIIEPEAQQPMKTLVDNRPMGWPAIVDFNRDRRTDIVYVDRQRNVLTALNQNGAALDHFPITAPDGTKFTGTPIITDVDGNGVYDILVMGRDSLSMNIYGYTNKGERLRPFPLYVGSVAGAGSRSVHPVLVGKKLYAVSPRGDLKGWVFPDMGDALWRSRYNRAQNNKISGFLDAPAEPKQEPQILKYSETYNWPNPSDDQTHIRFQLRAPGKVQIKIVTMDGTTIYNRTYQAQGGIPEELEISTSSWGSGVYYALVEGTVNGKTEKKLIKIAVVH